MPLFGSGPPSLQVAGAAWASGPLLPPRSGPFVLEGLPADTAVAVRAVLLDAALNGFQSVPQARVRTPPSRECHAPAPPLRRAA